MISYMNCIMVSYGIPRWIQIWYFIDKKQIIIFLTYIIEHSADDCFIVEPKKNYAQRNVFFQK